MSESEPKKRDGEATVLPASERRRALLKVLTASAGAYAMPMVASFSMSGLRIGEAAAQTGFCPPGLVGTPPWDMPDGRPFSGDQPSGRPFSGSFDVPGKPFVGNQPRYCPPD